MPRPLARQTRAARALVVLAGAVLAVAACPACDDGAQQLTADGDATMPVDDTVVTTEDTYQPTRPDFGPITMTPDACETEPTSAGVAPMRMLTRNEFDLTLRDLLGVEPIAEYLFPAENLVDGWENDAYLHAPSPLLVRNYLDAAELVAVQVQTEMLDELVPCALEPEADFACVDGFLRDYLPRAFRRPVTQDELAAFQDLARTGLELFTPADAVGMIVEASLQSPQFLYRIEPQDDVQPGELVPVDDWAMPRV